MSPSSALRSPMLVAWYAGQVTGPPSMSATSCTSRSRSPPRLAGWRHSSLVKMPWNEVPSIARS